MFFGWLKMLKRVLCLHTLWEFLKFSTNIYLESSLIWLHLNGWKSRGQGPMAVHNCFLFSLLFASNQMWTSVGTTMVDVNKSVSTPWGATSVSAHTASSSVTTSIPASTALMVRLGMRENAVRKWEIFVLENRSLRRAKRTCQILFQALQWRYNAEQYLFRWSKSSVFGWAKGDLVL